MHEILPGVLHWTARHPNLDMDVSSYALVPERLLLNPLAPRPGLDPPEAVVLTNRHHVRDAPRLGVPVHVPRPGLDAVADQVDAVPYDDGDTLPGGLVARAVGALSPDEFALELPRVRALALADTLIRDGDGPLAFVPDGLLGEDPEQVRADLRAAFARLLDEVAFDHLLLAHGDPVVGTARDDLRAFLSASR